jgi:hypothetical protein
LALSIAEDAHNGHAQFTIRVDGTQIGGIQTAAASHAAGQTQVFNVMGAFATGSDGKQVSTGEVTSSHALNRSQAIDFASVLASGTHDLAISFLNDAYAGTPQTDRNLYVGGISVNGVALPNSTVPMMSAQTSHFDFLIG